MLRPEYAMRGSCLMAGNSRGLGQTAAHPFLLFLPTLPVPPTCLVEASSSRQNAVTTDGEDRTGRIVSSRVTSLVRRRRKPARLFFFLLTSPFSLLTAASSRSGSATHNSTLITQNFSIGLSLPRDIKMYLTCSVEKGGLRCNTETTEEAEYMS